MKHISIVLILCFMMHYTSVAQELLTISWEGRNRYCWVHTPSTRPGETNLPVVFDLHGYGVKPLEERDYTRMHVLGDSVGFISVFPAGANDGWNSGENYVPLLKVDDVGFISKIIDTLATRYRIDTTRVFACGWSNGASMCLTLAARLSQRIAAVASVAGFLTRTAALTYVVQRPIPIMMINGTADGIVPLSGGYEGWFPLDSAITFLRSKNNCTLPAESLFVPNTDTTDLSTVEKYTYRSPNNLSQVVLFKVLGGGHTWPGAKVLTDDWAGNTNLDIDASHEIWNFFKQFSLTNPGPFVGVGVEWDPFIRPSTFLLSQNYPNPFNPTTVISYQLPVSSKVTLKIYDVLGREVATLVNEEQSAGWKEVKWNASTFASGMYLVRMQARQTNGGQAGNFTETKKTLLLK